MFDPLPNVSRPAQLSMHLGFFSVVLGFVTGIPAIILGYKGKAEIEAAQGELLGKEYAFAGLAFGYICSVLSLLGILIYILSTPRFLQMEEQAQQQKLRSGIAAAQSACSMVYAESLLEEKPFSCGNVNREIDGYGFEEMHIFISSMGDTDHDGNIDGCAITATSLDGKVVATDTWEYLE